MYPVVFPHAAERALTAELAALRQHGFQVRVVAPGDRRGLRAALTDAVLLWHSPGGAPLAADQFAEAPRLRLVQALGSGPAARAVRDQRHRLCRGVVRSESKAAYLDEIARLRRAGADGVILGCTEITMLVGQADLDLPVFDTTRIHAEAAIDFATGASS